MQKHLLDEQGNVGVLAAGDSSPEDFDFLIGRWKIHNKKLVKRLSDCREWNEFAAFGECRKLLSGLANIDFFKTEFDGKPFEGMALRLFNPETKLWSIYWANSETVTLDVPQVGFFKNKIGKFYAEDFWDRQKIVVLYHWDATDENAPVWSQAFSPDDGATWEWNWCMTFHRQN